MAQKRLSKKDKQYLEQAYRFIVRFLLEEISREIKHKK